MVDRHSFHLENVGGQDVTTILESFGLEYYGSAPSVPPQIVVPGDAGDLSALAELLSERRGARIECFDVSTAMGQDNVGSLVVFQDGLPKKAHYRKFAIRGQEGMDDFAA